MNSTLKTNRRKTLKALSAIGLGGLATVVTPMAYSFVPAREAGACRAVVRYQWACGGRKLRLENTGAKHVSLDIAVPTRIGSEDGRFELQLELPERITLPGNSFVEFDVEVLASDSRDSLSTVPVNDLLESRLSGAITADDGALSVVRQFTSSMA